MESYSFIDIIKAYCFLISIVATLGFLYFRMRDAQLIDSEKELIRQWYKEKWDAIKKSTLLNLPKNIISGLLCIKIDDYLFVQLLKVGVNNFGFHARVITYGGLNIFDMRAGGFYALIAFIFYFLIEIKVLPSIPKLIIFVEWLLMIFALYCLMFYVTDANSTVLVSFALSFPLAFLFTPFFVFLIDHFQLNFIGFNNDTRRKIILYSSLLGISFTISLASLILGKLIQPNSLIPISRQLLLSNSIFDLVTVFFTIKFLNLMHRSRSHTIPLLIVIDLSFAGLFACMSIYVGLFNSNQAISFYEAFWLLFGLKEGINGVFLGPQFWIMHTTFIPSFVYLSIIFFASISKIIMTLYARVLNKGSLVEKPYHMVSTTFAFIGGLHLAIYQIVDYFM